MRKTTIILLIVLAVCIGVAWIAWHAYHQLPPSSINVSVKFLHYTNDSSGGRYAVIGVTNRGASTIFVYRPLIEIPDKTSPSGLDFDQSHRPLSWHARLGGDASDDFTIPLPTNQSPWRVTLLVYNDLGLELRVMRMVTGAARRMPYGIQGDWISNQPPNTALEPTATAP